MKYTGRKKIGQRALNRTQASGMGNKARRFDAEFKIVGRSRSPSGKTLGLLQGIKSPVNFDAVHRARCKVKLIFLAQTLRVEGAAPGRIAPAGNTDADLCVIHTLNPRPS